MPANDVSSGRLGANVPGFRGSDVGRRNLGLVPSVLSVLSGGGLRMGGVGGRGAATTVEVNMGTGSAGTLIGCSGGGVDSGALWKFVVLAASVYVFS